MIYLLPNATLTPAESNVYIKTKDEQIDSGGVACDLAGRYRALFLFNNIRISNRSFFLS